MTKLFNEVGNNLFNAVYDGDDEIQGFELNFNDIDDLENTVDKWEDEFDNFDAGDIVVTINENVENDGYITKFILKFNELDYSLLLDIGNGYYDDYLEEDGDYYYAFKYLTEFNNYSAEDAIDKKDEVMIYQGSASDYVEQWTRDIGGKIPDSLDRYIDWDYMADDWKRGGDLIEIEDDVWVTNGYSI